MDAEQLAAETPLQRDGAARVLDLARSAGWSDEQLVELVCAIGRTRAIELTSGRLAYEAYARISSGNPPAGESEAE